MRGKAGSLLLLGACSFLISVPGKLPDDRARLECAKDGTCCPDTTLFPALDGLAAISIFVLALAMRSNCENEHCSNNTKVAYEYAPYAAAATLTAAAIYGVHENERCKELQREAARKLEPRH